MLIKCGLLDFLNWGDLRKGYKQLLWVGEVVASLFKGTFVSDSRDLKVWSKTKLFWPANYILVALIQLIFSWDLDDRGSSASIPQQSRLLTVIEGSFLVQDCLVQDYRWLKSRGEWHCRCGSKPIARLAAMLASVQCAASFFSKLYYLYFCLCLTLLLQPLETPCLQNIFFLLFLLLNWSITFILKDLFEMLLENLSAFVSRLVRDIFILRKDFCVIHWTKLLLQYSSLLIFFNYRRHNL